MRRFSVTIEIEAPPSRVWAVMVDVERWPEWTPTVTSIVRLDSGPFAVGSRVIIRQPKLPPTTWRLTELDAGRSFTWVAGSPGVRVTAVHGVEAAGHGSRVTLAIQFSGALGSLAAWMTSGLNDRYLALEAAGLKARSEGSVESFPAPPAPR